jgi:hypothetical protein
MVLHSHSTQILGWYIKTGYEKKMAVFWALMMEPARTSETLVNFYQTTRRYNPEDSHLRTHRRENLRSYTGYDNFLPDPYLLTFLNVSPPIRRYIISVVETASLNNLRISQHEF